MSTPDLPGLSRRTAGRVILAAAAIPSAAALGQPASRTKQPATTQPASPGTITSPAQPVKSVLDDLMKRGRSRDWTLKVTVHVQASQESNNGKDIHQHIPIKFDTAAVVFPVLTGTASSETHVSEPKDLNATLTFNDREGDTTAELKDGFDCGTRLGRWTLKNREGREMELKLELPMSCWETQFDEAAASKIPWPASGKWGKVGQTCFRPQRGVDSGDQRIVGLLNEWTNGKDPKSLAPVVLAKFLAGKVVELVQVSGVGLAGAPNGMVEGVMLQGAARTVIEGKGNPHDMACTLCAFYRAAKLPARLVVGYDIKEKKGDESFLDKGRGKTNLRSWVEFCLYDEVADKEIWIPVDPVRMRERSSRVGKLDTPWEYFGTHDELNDVLPFAHQYHPPASGVVAHGSPGFWGWITTPRVQIAEQWLRFDSQTTPKRPAPKKKPATK